MTHNRVIKQQEAVKAWVNNPKSTLNMCTGSGKTYTSIQIIELVHSKIGEDFKCLIIVPTTIIRDEVFPNEFKKFNKEYLLRYCQIECIQTIYKYTDQFYHLVVVDEIHNMCYKLGEEYEYFKFFENNTYKYLLGLSASIADEYLPSLNRIAPISFKLTLSEAVTLGIVSPFIIYNVNITLNHEELKLYNSTQNSYNYYEALLGGPYKAFTNANILMKSNDEEGKKTAFIFHNLIRKRKSILDNAINKKFAVNEILSNFKNSNGLIFSESIIQAGKLIEENDKAIVYHSKLKKSERLNAINRLNSVNDKVHIISAVKALNEGLSIDSIEFTIITAGNSKIKDTIQRIGRTCRFVENKIAYIFRLYVKNTQEEKWVKKSQLEINQDFIKYVNLEDLLKELTTKT